MASPGSPEYVKEQNALNVKKAIDDKTSQSGGFYKTAKEAGIGGVMERQAASEAYQNPGAYQIDVKGRTADAAKHMGDNDAAQAANKDAINLSSARMRMDRGQMNPDNPILAAKAAASRNQQGDALNQSMQAAMGGAPSAAEAQTRLGMNEIAGKAAGQAGMARGLAGMGGAQMNAASNAGESGGALAYQGGLGRSKEISDAMGMYGSQAGQMRGQDLTALGTSNQNQMFNAGLNDDWKLGNANLAANQMGLGAAQHGTDLQWLDQSMKPAEMQFGFNQEAQGWQAGANSDATSVDYAKMKEQAAQDAATKGALIQGGITLGSMGIGAGIGKGLGSASQGSQIGGQLGGMAGSAGASSTKKYY